MPPAVRKLNAVAGLALLLAGCTRKLDIEVNLVWSEAPDPFARIETVRMRALVGGQMVALGEDRWDQGPIALPVPLDPTVERLVVEGLTSDGEVVSSGASASLDLLHAPPEGPISIFFSQVGVLTRLSAVGPARFGGARAVALDDGRILFLGGRDASGCMVESTEVASIGGIEAGPPIAGGRAGRYFAGRLTDGRVLVIGGEVAPGCSVTQVAEDVAILDVAGGAARVARVGPEVSRPGSAVAAVSSALAIIGGGDGTPVPSAAVQRFSPTTLEFNQIGNLESPRTGASAAVISDQRVLFVGGRTNTSTASALGTATVFVPERGSPLTDQIPLRRKVIRPAVITSRSGAVIVAGGIDASGLPSDRIDAVIVRTERDFPIGDTSTVTALAAPVAGGQLTELGDGSLLLFPEEGGPIRWIRFLPSRAVAIPPLEGLTGPLAGARLPDGRALLRAEDGTYLSFNPGPGAALGLYGAQGELAAGPQELGVVPLRPAAWQRTEEGLAAFRAAPPGSTLPEELAVLLERPFGDFDVTFDLELEGQAKAAIAFGLNDDRFDYAVLAGASFVDRAPAGFEPRQAGLHRRRDPGPRRARLSSHPGRADPGSRHHRPRRRRHARAHVRDTSS